MIISIQEFLLFATHYQIDFYHSDCYPIRLLYHLVLNMSKVSLD